jgi:hypothetical protein
MKFIFIKLVVIEKYATLISQISNILFTYKRLWNYSSVYVFVSITLFKFVKFVLDFSFISLINL